MPPLLGAEERIEELRDVVGRDASTSVAHAQAQSCRRLALTDTTIVAPVGGQPGDGVHRIEHEIDEHLLDLDPVDQRRGRRIAVFRTTRVDLPAPRFGLEEGARIADDLA